MADGRPSLISAICYQNPRAALAWLEQAFGFKVVMLIEDPAGDFAHAEMALGDAVVMIGAEWSADHKGPKSIGGQNTQTVHLQIDTDVDAHCARARAAGAEIIAEAQTQFYGDRTTDAAIPKPTSGPWGKRLRRSRESRPSKRAA